ncbi:MAG: DUF998 domain-containing protein [Thermoactinospora sp.]|nr:DUF998 domain-containing protein [Thermoactinospora sp.]
MKQAVITGSLVGALAFALSDIVNTGMSPVEETVSRFVNTDAGWLVTVGLLAIAAGSAVLTAMVARAGLSRLGTGLLAVWSAGILVAAIFPADPPGRWDDPSLSETVHGLAAWVALLALMIAAIVITRALPRDPVLLAMTVAVVVGLLLFLITLVDAMATRSLPPLLGVTERIALAADLGWLVVAAVRGSGYRRSRPYTPARLRA